MEKDIQYAGQLLALIEKGATLDFRQVIFCLKPNADKGYSDFMKNLVGQ